MMLNIPVLVLMGASILWGLSWLPLKEISVTGIGGITQIFLTYGILTLLLIPIVLRDMKVIATHKKALLLIALFGGGANLAFTYALINGEVIRVMVLFYMLPVWGVLGGKLFLKESIDIWRYFGMGLAVIGAFLILGGFSAFSAPPSWIDLIALLSGLFFAMNNLVFRATQSVKVSAKTTIMFLGCVVLAGTLLLGGVEEVSFTLSGETWTMILAYSIFWLFLANIGSQWGVTHMEAGRSSIIIILELITAVISASLLTGETMTLVELLGGAFILSAAFIEALRTKDDDIPETII
jgi:drug/metabolite transporter (DMT)-like permease